MIKVKQSNAVSAYNVLKQIKTKELPAEVAIAIWKNVKVLKPIATSYEEAIKDSKESLKGRLSFLVEMVGFEPMTSALRTRRSPN